MKTHRFAILSVLAFSALTLFSCAPESESTGDVQKTDCPEEIAARAFRFAELYRDSETQYAWGVTERNYEVSDKRLKSFGIMQVAK